MCAELSGRYMCWEGRVVGVVLQEGTEEMDIEELEEHANQGSVDDDESK